MMILRYCCFVITCIPYRALNNKILFSLYGKYLAMNLDCDGTWQIAQVSCSFAATFRLVYKGAASLQQYHYFPDAFWVKSMFFKWENSQSHTISSQSLLLSTTILNDED